MAITLFKNKTGSLWNPSSAKRCLKKQTSAEIVFTGTYVQWKHNEVAISSMRAQIGDTVKYINSTTVGCYDSNSNERWRVVASKAANTPYWEFTGTPSITNFTYAITSTESKSVVASGVGIQKMKYSVTVSAGSGWTGVYTSTSSTATSGNASGHKYEVGERVYYFAKTTDAILANYFAPFTLSTPIYTSNGTKYYCIGSVYVLTSNQTVSIPALEAKPITIYFAGVGTDWKVNGAGESVPHMTAYYGDYLSVSGSTVTCKYPSKATRWTVVASLMADTVEWDIGGSVALTTINDEQITSVKTISNDAGTAVKKKYAVSINGLGTAGSTTGYLSTSLTATSGSNSGSTFDYGANVFAFAKIPHATLSTYTTPSSWEYRQHDASSIYYLAGSLGQVTENTNKNIIYASSLSAKQSVTINLTGTGITWKQSNTTRTSMTAYVGDKIKNTSSTAVGCYYTGADGTLQLRWSVTATRSADTTQYKYTGTPTMTSFEWTLTSTTSKTITAGGVTRAFQKYAVSITKPSIATEAYTASSSTATGADATSFDYGSTVYGFVRMPTGDAAYYDLSAAGWTQVYCNGPDSYYRVGSVTVTGAVSVSYTTPSLKKSTVSITKGTDWYSAYVSTSSSATSGNTSGSFEYGTTVYGFAKVLLTTANYYTAASNWVPVYTDSLYCYYRVGYTTTGLTNSTISYTNWTRRPITVNISAPSYVKATYLSTSGQATSGAATGTAYAPGTTVYGYVKIDPTYFNANTSWTSVGQDSNGYICYRVGSVTVPTTLTNTAQSIRSGNAVGLSATVYLGNTYVDWKVNGSSVDYCTAYNGDRLVAANATVSCSDQDGNVRWTATATRKANTAQYTYTGTPTITLPYTTVMGTGTVNTGGVTRTINKYTVKWYNGSTLLETDNNVEYGTQPDYNGSNPTKASTAQYSYTWSNQWSTNSSATSGVAESGLPAVTGNVSYYAVGWLPTTRKYTVTWKSQDGNTTLETDNNVAYGTKPTCSVTPTKSSTAQYNYTFVGWSTSKNAESGTSQGNLSGITGNTTYYAAFSKTVRAYTVNWYDHAGILLETDSTNYGAQPDYNGNTPSKSATAQYSYTFTGWAKNTGATSGTLEASLPAVTGAVNYYAAFKENLRSYTVTWKSQDGNTTLETDNNVSYGTSPTYNGVNPSKSSTTQYNFTFNGWSTSKNATSGTASGSLPGITGATTYYAAFTPTTRKYAVTVTKPTIADEVWLSTSSGAQSGSASGATFNYGSTVYAGVKVNASTASTYNISKDVCGWTQINATGQYNYYMIGSVNVTGAVTLTYTNPSKKSSVININTTAGISSVYLSTDSKATSGKASGTSFEYGTVYGFAKVAGSSLSDYNIPGSWVTVNYDGSYYTYRVGSIQADGSASRTISYEAMAAKPQLNVAGLTLSYSQSASVYNLTVFNNNGTTVTVSGTWYNASGTQVGTISSFTLGSYGSSGTYSLALSKADAAYVKVTLSASGYKSSTNRTDVVYGKIQAPQLISTDVKSESYKTEYRTNVWYTYDKYVTATIKNPNSFQVSVIPESNNVEYAYVRGFSNTVAAGATTTVPFSAVGGGSITIKFAASGKTPSNTITVTCPSDSGGGDGGGTT